MSKSNIQHLRDILSVDTVIVDKTEALEFLESVEEELSDKEDEIKELQKEIDELEDMEEGGAEDGEFDPSRNDNSNFVGLDTIHWTLEKGNLRVQQQMESFIEGLRKQNCVGAMNINL